MESIKLILQVIGLVVVVWFVWIASEEYMKLRQERKEKDNEQSRGL